MKNKKKNSYEFGSFVKANASSIGNVGGLAAGLLDNFKNPNTANIGITTGQGILSGAAAGAALGPLGMAGGAIIGGITGLVGSSKQKRILDDNRNAMYGNLQAEALNGMSTTNINPYGTQIYQDGGDVIMDNQINIEKGELQIDPATGKILREYKGINPETGGFYQKHNSKGKDTKNNFVFAEPDTFIITADKAKKYKDAVDNNDKLAQETILQNIRNYKSKVDKKGNLKFAIGGEVPYIFPQAANAPWHPSNSYGVHPVNPYVAPVNVGIVNRAVSPNLNVPTNIGTQMQNTQKQVGINNTKNFMTANGIQPLGTESNFTKGLNTIAQYGPAALNLARGLFSPVEQQAYATPIVNPYTAQIEANLPQDINMQPIYNDINAQARLTDRTIRNNVNSSAVYRANRQNLGASTGRQLASAKLQGDIANNQIRGQRANIYSGLGSQAMQEAANVRQINLGIDQINAQNRAAKSDLLGTGLSQLQQVYMNNKRNDQLYNIDMFKAGLLPQIYGNLQYYPEILKQYLNLGR